jgi:hypothetical protein
LNRLDLAGSFTLPGNLFQEALQMAQRSSDNGPLAAAWYSFACGAASPDIGSQDVANMANDEDLMSLRSESRGSPP